MTDSPAVYSSVRGRLCPACGEAHGRCRCGKGKGRPDGDGVARVRREKKGRGGKTVTTISGLSLDQVALRDLTTALKRRCGAGGALKDGVVEIQGDHADVLMAELEARGLKAKRAGG